MQQSLAADVCAESNNLEANCSQRGGRRSGGGPERREGGLEQVRLILQLQQWTFKRASFGLRNAKSEKKKKKKNLTARMMDHFPFDHSRVRGMERQEWGVWCGLM